MVKHLQLLVSINYHGAHYSEVFAKARVDCIVNPPSLIYYLTA